MTDDKASSPNTPTELPVVESVPARAPTTKAEPPARQSGLGWVWLVLLLVIAGVGAAAFYAWQLFNQQSARLVELQTTLAQTQENTRFIQQQVESTLEQQLQNHKAQLDEQQQELAQRLDALAGRVLTIANVDREDWKLTEAEHLLRMANQRVLLERNGTNALALAQQVDDILRGLNQAGLQDVRRTLANDMAELRFVGELDREGIYLRLLALAEQIEKLPLIESVGQEDEAWQLEEDENDTGWWARIKRGANQLLRKFSDHLRIRDHGTDVPALLSPEARQYVKQNLHQMLEQAQTALLREQVQIYQASLTKAQDWLVRYYPLSDNAITLQAELAALQEINISQTLPDFTESAALLRHYIERRHARALGANSDREGGDQ